MLIPKWAGRIGFSSLPGGQLAGMMGKRNKTAGEIPLLGTGAVGAKMPIVKGRYLAWEKDQTG